MFFSGCIKIVIDIFGRSTGFRSIVKLTFRLSKKQRSSIKSSATKAAVATRNRNTSNKKTATSSRIKSSTNSTNITEKVRAERCGVPKVVGVFPGNFGHVQNFSVKTQFVIFFREVANQLVVLDIFHNSRRGFTRQPGGNNFWPRLFFGRFRLVQGRCPKKWEAQNFAFFLGSSHGILVVLWNRRNVHVWILGLSCETPAAAAKCQDKSNN